MAIELCTVHIDLRIMNLFSGCPDLVTYQSRQGYPGTGQK